MRQMRHEATKPRSYEAGAPASVALSVAALIGAVVFLTLGFSASPVRAGGLVAAGSVEGVPNAVSGGALEAILFYLVAGGVVLSVVGVCVSRNIVRMAVWLFVALGSVAMLYFMLAATFLGAIQLIVYAGGTLVLLVFGVMLTSKSPWVKFECGRLELAAASVVCASLAVTLGLAATRTTWSATPAVVPGPSMTTIGTELLTKYVVPFEIAGVLLMIVMVGAAYLARQED